MPWPVWNDSTTAKVRFAPLSKKQPVRLYHKARDFGAHQFWAASRYM